MPNRPINNSQKEKNILAEMPANGANITIDVAYGPHPKAEKIEGTPFLPAALYLKISLIRVSSDLNLEELTLSTSYVNPRELGSDKDADFDCAWEEVGRLLGFIIFHDEVLRGRIKFQWDHVKSLNA